MRKISEKEEERNCVFGKNNMKYEAAEAAESFSMRWKKDQNAVGCVYKCRYIHFQVVFLSDETNWTKENFLMYTKFFFGIGRSEVKGFHF